MSDSPTYVQKTAPEQSEPVLKTPPDVKGFSYTGTDWMTTTAGCFPIYYYQAPDGSKLSVTDNSYESAEEARKGIQEIIKTAKRVVEQTSVADVNGDWVGERVLLQMRASLPYDKPVHLFWIVGKRWFEVQGQSIEQVIAFENEYKAVKRLTRRQRAA